MNKRCLPFASVNVCFFSFSVTKGYSANADFVCLREALQPNRNICRNFHSSKFDRLRIDLRNDVAFGQVIGIKFSNKPVDVISIVVKKISIEIIVGHTATQFSGLVMQVLNIATLANEFRDR